MSPPAASPVVNPEGPLTHLSHTRQLLAEDTLRNGARIEQLPRHNRHARLLCIRCDCSGQQERPRRIQRIWTSVISNQEFKEVLPERVSWRRSHERVADDAIELSCAGRIEADVSRRFATEYHLATAQQGIDGTEAFEIEIDIEPSMTMQEEVPRGINPHDVL